MRRLRRSNTSVIPGKRVGTKRRDMRWLAPDGTEWDSRFEYEVFLAYKQSGARVRRCGPEDRVSYTRPVRNAVCRGCTSADVVTTHIYTPDLFVDQDGHEGQEAGGPFVIECKGYLRADRRSLLRALCKARPDMRLRLIVQRDYPINKRGTTITEWARKFLRIPVAVWSGTPPNWRTE